MGIISPNKTIKTAKKVDRKYLDSALSSMATEQITDGDGNLSNYAQGLARRVWDIALYAESDKDSITAAKFISERLNGKPAVIVEEEKEEIPAITFRVHTGDANKIKELASRPDVEEEPTDKVVVNIDGEPTMEF